MDKGLISSYIPEHWITQEGEDPAAEEKRQQDY